MIYGYERRSINEHGLKLMKEISVVASPEDQQALGEFLREAAEELRRAESDHWHKHLPQKLQQAIGCDVIVLSGKPDASR